MTAASPAASTGPMPTRSAATAARPQISARLPVSDRQIQWRRQPDGPTVLEVTDQAGNLTGLVASTRLPIISVDGAWRGIGRGADGSRQWRALASGHACTPDGPLTVTFTRRSSRTAIHSAAVDGSPPSPGTTPQRAAIPARQLMPVTPGHRHAELRPRQPRTAATTSPDPAPASHAVCHQSGTHPGARSVSSAAR